MNYLELLWASLRNQHFRNAETHSRIKAEKEKSSVFLIDFHFYENIIYSPKSRVQWLRVSPPWNLRGRLCAHMMGHVLTTDQYGGHWNVSFSCVGISIEGIIQYEDIRSTVSLPPLDRPTLLPTARSTNRCPVWWESRVCSVLGSISAASPFVRDECLRMLRI